MQASTTPPRDVRRDGGRQFGIAAIVIAAVAVVLAATAALREPAPPAAGAGGTPGDPALARQFADLQAEVHRLTARLEQLEPGGARTEVFDRERAAAVLDELLAARGLAAARKPAPGAGASAGTGAAVDVRTLVGELARLGPGARSDELWAKLRAAGAIDEAVRWFEQQAAANPNNPDAQTALGAAYVQQLLQSSDEAQRIEIGKQIEAQFDRALELQPDHWEARFRKAVGLSYAPVLAGRRDDAIAQFEQLVTQQANLPPTPEQAQTYLFLGRLYEQQGDRAHAATIWRQGLQRHPQDPELQRQSAGR
jgi:tetratricopeptide (TPR) repeat protein